LFFRWLLITILVQPTRTSVEPDLLKEIKSKVDVSIDSKTMGHFLGYVGPL